MKLDKKFYGEIRKAKDDSIVPEDQSVVFLAKDSAFAMALPHYLFACKLHGADATHIKLVEELIENVMKWRRDHPELCKVPDAAGEKVLS